MARAGGAARARSVPDRAVDHGQSGRESVQSSVDGVLTNTSARALAAVENGNKILRDPSEFRSLDPDLENLSHVLGMLKQVPLTPGRRCGPLAPPAGHSHSVHCHRWVAGIP